MLSWKREAQAWAGREAAHAEERLRRRGEDEECECARLPSGRKEGLQIAEEKEKNAEEMRRQIPGEDSAEPPVLRSFLREGDESDA
eukprot:3169755-Rhodomonas_salina.1